MIARHTSTCDACSRPIRPGQTIVPSDGLWVHADCGTPTNPLCRRCWLHHAGDCI